MQTGPIPQNTMLQSQASFSGQKRKPGFLDIGKKRAKINNSKQSHTETGTRGRRSGVRGRPSWGQGSSSRGRGGSWRGKKPTWNSGQSHRGSYQQSNVGRSIGRGGFSVGGTGGVRKCSVCRQGG